MGDGGVRNLSPGTRCRNVNPRPQLRTTATVTVGAPRNKTFTSRNTADEATHVS